MRRVRWCPRRLASAAPRAAATAALLVSLVSLAACDESSDLGQTCRMTIPAAERGGLAQELPAARVERAELDYVAFGTAECDNLVCLRTAGSPNPENENGGARGYCSAPCVSQRDCEPNFRGEDGALTCEELMPNVEQLRRDDLESFEAVFGPGTSTRYCILRRSR